LQRRLNVLGHEGVLHTTLDGSLKSRTSIMVSWVGYVNQIQKNVNKINFTVMTETNQQQQRKRKSDQTKISIEVKMEV